MKKVFAIALCVLSSVNFADIFETGDNQFTIDFVSISGATNPSSGYLSTYYNRIARTRGSGKAIIATARKLLGIIYKTLINDWVFEDFPNFVIATP